MATALLLSVALAGQLDPHALPNRTALATHLGLEVDDLDHEIIRHQGALRIAQERLASTQRAVERGLASRSELESVIADVRALEARDAEAAAFRALKVYERDVYNGTVARDEDKAYTLVLDVLKKQEGMAQAELDYQTYRLRQEEALVARGAGSRPELDVAGLDYEAARSHLALSQARQAQLAFERAQRKGAAPAESAGLRTACLQARARYYEIGAGIAKTRLDIARDMQRHQRMTPSDVDWYQRGFDEAERLLDIERKRLADPAAPVPTAMPRVN